MSLKKYITSIQKNQSTAQDDIFMKPDPTKVTGMRHGSYDKLNDNDEISKEQIDYEITDPDTLKMFDNWKNQANTEGTK